MKSKTAALIMSSAAFLAFAVWWLKRN